MDSSVKFVHKLVLLGYTKAGKSSIITRIVHKNFDKSIQSTIGVAFFTMTIDIDNDTKVKFEIWDSSGQDNYASLVPVYYREASIIILVYDITDKKTFEKMQYQYNNLLPKYNDATIIAVVGNKIDLADELREVSTEEGTEFTKKNNLPFFFETSAKTGQNIDLMFTNLAEHIAINRGVVVVK